VVAPKCEFAWHSWRNQLGQVHAPFSMTTGRCFVLGATTGRGFGFVATTGRGVVVAAL
jgi:hypothetical protein